jgi:glyoxylase-like metal-dependent hydrolase (beta-lactamase superfamily II)
MLLPLFVFGGWTFAHFAIRAERPMLPPVTEVLALAQDEDRPTRLRWIDTSTQEGLDGTIVHPVFVLEWKDGRVLLVDTGMDAEAAVEFGEPAEWLLGSEPTVVGRPIDEALAGTRKRLVGLVFTHMHSDHTQGIKLLCFPEAGRFDLYMPPAQFERSNYTTRIGGDPVENAPCASRIPLPDEGLGRLPGLAGVGVIRAAGHTPGSQMIVAWVGRKNPRGYVLAGDVVFEFDQIPQDRPKSLLYRLLVTPEADVQLGEVRRWLQTLSQDHALDVVPSHDLAHLQSLDLAEFIAIE